MKNVFAMVFLVVGMTTFAQVEKQEAKRTAMEQLSPEQRNQLHLKKLTLELGLNESQQKEMSKIIAEQTTKMDATRAERKAMKEKGIKPTGDERFAKQNQRLDDEIAMKSRVQKILSPDQFKKWEEMKKERREHIEKRMEKKERKSQKPQE
jgi:hypothetical protein